MRHSFLVIGGKQVWILLNEKNSTGLILRLGYFIILYYFGGFLFKSLEEIWIFKEYFLKCHKFLSIIILQISKWLMHFFYSSISSNSDFVVLIDKTKIIQLLPGCTGLIPMFRMTFIICFYPLQTKKKIWVYPISLLFLLFATIIHFIILIPIAYKSPGWFSVSHDWITQIIFYGLFFLVLVFWEKIFEKNLVNQSI